ncbi:hypothetical protein FOA52_003955 [Chlamydomonas sp. UWO 241]|nr:hypothetical protein FOA52_003955 [Chlamydomonas sp. UWO 241]
MVLGLQTEPGFVMDAVSLKVPADMWAGWAATPPNPATLHLRHPTHTQRERCRYRELCTADIDRLFLVIIEEIPFGGG